MGLGVQGQRGGQCGRAVYTAGRGGEGRGGEDGVAGAQAPAGRVRGGIPPAENVKLSKWSNLTGSVQFPEDPVVTLADPLIPLAPPSSGSGCPGIWKYLQVFRRLLAVSC